jgi:hypothetical protein
VGISSSNRVDITAVNDGVYINSRKMSDSGWVDLSSYLASGISGTLKIRIIDGLAYLAMSCSGFRVASMTSVTLTSALPAKYLPRSDFPTDRITGTSGFYSGVVSLYLTGGNTGLIKMQNLESGTADNCHCTFTPYALG